MENKVELPAGWFYPNDITFYRKTFEGLRNGATVLEIGCWKGRSICSVADIIKKKNIEVYVIDNFKGSESEVDDAHKEAKEIDIEAIFRKAITDFEITDNVRVINADTRAFRWDGFADKFFDFIFVDGEHTTEAVGNDVNKCLPKLKDGGIIAGHDLEWATVKTAVDNIFGDNYSVVIGNHNIWKHTKEIRMKDNTVLLSCWSKPLRDGKHNAKNPSEEWWLKLISLLKEKGYTVWQCGQGEEKKLATADAHIWDKDLWKLGEDIEKCVAWVSPDNFMGHWALLQFKKPGIVIWSQSDPDIFGHAANVNLLKDKKYLREKQFELWEAATWNADAFPTTEEVIIEVEKLVLKNNKYKRRI